MVVPLGPGGLTVWWDEAPLQGGMKVSIAPHYFLIPTGLNLEFSTEIILISSLVGGTTGILIGAMIIGVICYYRSQSLSPMRFKYEQILTIVKKIERQQKRPVPDEGQCIFMLFLIWPLITLFLGTAYLRGLKAQEPVGEDWAGNEEDWRTEPFAPKKIS